MTAGRALLAIVAWLTVVGMGCIQRPPPVQYDYFFDRNAIRDFCVAERYVLGVTESGNLLRLQLPELSPIGERCDLNGAVLLARNRDGRIALCREDGSSVWVDPATLADTPLAPARSTNAHVEWCGFDSQGRFWTLHPDDSRGNPHGAIVLANATEGEIWRIPDIPGNLHGLIDSHDRIWIGIDRGEFGQAVWRFDIVERNLHMPFPGCPAGVFGFVETATGDVLAFGGVQHLGLNKGYIAKFHAGAFHIIEQTEPARHSVQPRQSFGPVSHLLYNPATLTPTLFSNNRPYEKPNGVWQPVAELSLRDYLGRPDSLSNYPAITHAEYLDADRLLVSTRRDGFLVITGTDVRHVCRENQLPISDARLLRSSCAGLVVGSHASYDDLLPACYASGEWRELDPRSSVPVPARVTGVAADAPASMDDDAVDDADEREREVRPWSRVRVLGIDRQGKVAVELRTAETPGPRAILNFDGSEWKVAQVSNECAVSYDSFITPDGAVWSLSDQIVEWQADDKWQRAEIEDFRALYSSYVCVLDQRATHTDVLFDETLLRLPVSSKTSRRSVQALSPTSKISDAIRLSEDRLLIVSDGRIHVAKNGLLQPHEVPGVNWSTLRPSCLLQTADGTIWIGGDGLIVTDGRRIRDFSNLGPLKGAHIEAIAQDTFGDNAVWVSLGKRGLVRLPGPPGLKDIQ